MNDFIVIRAFNTRIEAEVAKGLLEANNIKAIISADDAGGAYPFPMMSSSRGVQLSVEEKDVKKAKELLSQKG